MEVYKENTLVLRFSENSDFGNEPKIVKSIFNKFSDITKKAGFKNDFETSEIDLIRSISNTVNMSDDVK